MKVFFKIIPIIGLMLSVAILSGCVQMQRTDTLTQNEGSKVVQANNQLVQIVGSSWVGQIRQCGHNHKCLTGSTKNAQDQLAPILKTYQHAANSVRGNCHEALQPLAQSLADIDQALRDMSTPAGSKKASKQFSKALNKLPRSNSYLIKCSKQ